MNHVGGEQNLAGVIHMDFESQVAILICAGFFYHGPIQRRDRFREGDAFSRIERDIADALKFVAPNGGSFCCRARRFSIAHTQKFNNVTIGFSASSSR